MIRYDGGGLSRYAKELSMMAIRDDGFDNVSVETEVEEYSYS